MRAPLWLMTPMPAMFFSAMRLQATIAQVSGVTLTTDRPDQPSCWAVMFARAPSELLCSCRNLSSTHQKGFSHLQARGPTTPCRVLCTLYTAHT